MFLLKLRDERLCFGRFTREREGERGAKHSSPTITVTSGDFFIFEFSRNETRFGVDCNQIVG